MFVIGISGGSGSGKTTICTKLKDKLANKNVAILNQDSYYNDNKHLSPEERKKLNFDHPNALDFELLTDHIINLKNKIPIEKPDYSFLTNSRTNEKTHIEPPDILIVEGILVFSHEELRDLFHIKVFIDCNERVMLERISQRDKKHRGRDAKETELRFEQVVMPMYKKFVLQGKKHANYVVINNSRNNLDNIVQQIKELITNLNN